MVRAYVNTILKVCASPHLTRKQREANYLFALALDPSHGIIHDPSLFAPDFFIRNPNMFKAKKKNDPDTPGIFEALSGPIEMSFSKPCKVR